MLRFAHNDATHQAGMTLVELIISLAIGGMLLGVLGSSFVLTLQVSPRVSNELKVVDDLQSTAYWLNRDSSMAESFTALTTPQYGYFQWVDRTGATPATWRTTYYYDATNDYLMRQEEKDSVVQSAFSVARHILNQTDAVFTWYQAQKRVTVAMTSSILDAPGVGDMVRSTTLSLALRPRSEPITSPPSLTPIPTPLPGSVTYFVASNPTILTGTYVSGNAASLQSADSSFYVVQSVTSGGDKVVVWTAPSQNITSPTTITQLEVRFTGKVDKQNVIMEFFVQNSGAGYPATADSGFTFTQADTVGTHSFFLDATALAYVNTTRVVNLKVRGSASPTFALSADQVLFIASP